MAITLFISSLHFSALDTPQRITANVDRGCRYNQDTIHRSQNKIQSCQDIVKVALAKHLLHKKE